MLSLEKYVQFVWYTKMWVKAEYTEPCCHLQVGHEVLLDKWELQDCLRLAFSLQFFLLINSARIGNKSDTIAKNITAETVSPSYQI